MDISNITIGQLQQLQSMLGSTSVHTPSDGLNSMIGKKCIVRTYSAGVWFGVISEKSGNEVVVSKARRLWRWWAKESISLSAVAIHGIKHDKSKVVEPVDSVWLEAIELIPCSDLAIQSIESAKNVEAE